MEIIPVDLNNSNPLFKDYLEKNRKVRPFFQWHYREGFEALLKQIEKRRFDRDVLVAELEADNRSWGAPEPALQNIRKLKEKHTFAVVTGQQAGLFTGPMYTIYKTLTAIKIAEYLSVKYPVYHFVPLFWMEVDDNDFEEIRRIHYFDKQNQLREFEIEENEEENRQPVWMRKISEKLHHEQMLFCEQFPQTEFRDEVVNLFFNCYQTGQGLADAFACLLQRLFGRLGLVVFNPSNPGFKKLAAPVYEKALQQQAKIHERFRKNNEALELAGYPHQIKLLPEQTLLFMLDQEFRRRRLDTAGEGYVVRNGVGRSQFSRDEIHNLLREVPEKFSPNVALRPIVQDALIPTVAYVGGPSEVAYFAQVKPLYDIFSIPMPVIVPRHRITLAEARDQRVGARLGLDLSGILQNPQKVREKFVREKLNSAAHRPLEELGELVEAKLKEIQPLFRETDPTLMKPLDKTANTVKRALQQLSDRYLRAVENRNATQMNQIESILLHFYPGNAPQERVINVCYYLIKYGPGFIEALFQILPDEPARHFLVKF